MNFFILFTFNGLTDYKDSKYFDLPIDKNTIFALIF